MILFENRAADVLYKVLTNIKQKKFILPLNVCPIVPDTFLKAKKEIVFIDISLDTLCLDTDLVLKKLQNDKSIDGVLFVYTFGINLDMQPLYMQIKSINKDIFIIDDMCPSIQRFDIQTDKTYADLTLFSSGYSKFVDIGYGGYGFVDDSFKEVFEDKSQTKEFLKYKDNILETIPKMIAHKKELNDIYKQLIPSKYHLGERWNGWRFSILADNKNEIIDEIFKTEGLFASSHFPQVDFDYVENPKQNTNANKIHTKIINLFNDFRYTKEKALATAQIVKRLIK